MGAAVALENIAVIEEQNLIERVKHETGPYLKRRLNELLEFSCVAEIRTLGLLGAIEIEADNTNGSSQMDNVMLAAKIADCAFAKGLIARPLGAALGLMLPLIVTTEQIDELVEILREAIEEVG